MPVATGVRAIHIIGCMMLLWVSVACTFRPGKNAGPSDGSLRRDAFLSDAGFDVGADDAGLDAAIPDVVPTDIGLTPDAFDADAMPADADATVNDAANPDALPDAANPDAVSPDAFFADAPAPDAFVDASVSDAACVPAILNPVPQTAPRVATSLPLAWSPDVPPLIADLDGDGADEIVVASVTQAAIAIIDYEGCNAIPTITESSGIIPVGPSGLMTVTSSIGRTFVVSARDDQWALSTYDSTQVPHRFVSTTNFVANGSMAFMTGEPQAKTIAFFGGDLSSNGRAWFFFSTMNVLVDLPSPPLGPAAFLSQPTTNETAYALPTGNGVKVLKISSSASAVISNTDVGGTPSAPAVIGDPAAGPVYVAVGRTGSGQGLVGLVYNPQSVTTGNADRMNVSTNVFEPVASYWPMGDVAFYARTENDSIVGCRATSSGGNFSWSNCRSFALGAPNVSSSITPLLAFVDDDAAPDIVMAIQSRVHFVRHDLASSAIVGSPPVLPNGHQVKTTSAISARFFDRYTDASPGFLMVVPTDANAVDLVVWPRPPSAGNPRGLWLQHRADAQRTGHL